MNRRCGSSVIHGAGGIQPGRDGEKSMRNRRSIVWAGIIGLASWVMVTPASETRWQRVAELTTGGQAKEVPLTGDPISRIRILCVEGTVIINSVVLRENGNMQSYTVARRLTSGAEHVLEVGDARSATGLRISDAAKGRYEVFVQR